MTLKELSQLYYLKNEIENDKKRLARLKELAEKPPTPILTGMPGGGGKDSRQERYIAEIIDLEAIISAKIMQEVHTQNMLERYISDISDSLLRQILTLRFIDGHSWRAVAFRIGGGNTEAGVKMLCYRFLKNSEKTKLS